MMYSLKLMGYSFKLMMYSLKLTGYSLTLIDISLKLNSIKRNWNCFDLILFHKKTSPNGEV